MNTRTPMEIVMSTWESEQKQWAAERARMKRTIRYLRRQNDDLKRVIRKLKRKDDG